VTLLQELLMNGHGQFIQTCIYASRDDVEISEVL